MSKHYQDFIYTLPLKELSDQLCDVLSLAENTKKNRLIAEHAIFINNAVDDVNRLDCGEEDFDAAICSLECYSPGLGEHNLYDMKSVLGFVCNVTDKPYRVPSLDAAALIRRIYALAIGAQAYTTAMHQRNPDCRSNTHDVPYTEINLMPYYKQFFDLISVSATILFDTL